MAGGGDTQTLGDTQRFPPTVGFPSLHIRIIHNILYQLFDCITNSCLTQCGSPSIKQILPITCFKCVTKFTEPRFQALPVQQKAGWGLGTRLVHHQVQKVHHWTFIEGWESYTLGICMNVWCVYEARMSLTLKVQSRSTLNELKIRIRVVFNVFIWNCCTWMKNEGRSRTWKNLLTSKRFPPTANITEPSFRGWAFRGSVHP